MDQEKRNRIINETHMAIGPFIMEQLQQHGCMGDGNTDDEATAVFTGLVSGLLWTMAGAWGSQPPISFIMSCMVDYVDRMVPIADAKHAEIAARNVEEQEAAQQAELAAAQEAEAVR